MNSKILFTLILYFIFYEPTFANYPEFFGASYSTSAIGNQSTLDPSDPSNNYYSPAILGFSDKVNILLQASSTDTYFKKISNITISNNTNSSSSSVIGNVENKYPKFFGTQLHASLPIGFKHLGTLGISLFLPIGRILETNSGNPFLPEYVMYRSRYQRISTYFNFARKWNEDWAWSIGTLVGFQAAADINTNLSLNGAAYGSWGQAKSKITPSLGLVTSIVKKFANSKIYFSYQQEMKSNLHANLSGEINNPSLMLFESAIDTMIFYDPHTFRLGAVLVTGPIHQFFLSMEYQLWNGYKPPTIYIKKTGGVIVPSNTYENIKIQNTLNPRLGFSWGLSDRFKWGVGIQYRMTPLKGDFSGSGNSIDANTYIFTTGLEYRIVIWSKDVNLGTSFQFHQLQKKEVTKTRGQENENMGNKIGAPGYEIDGQVLSGSFGIKFNF